MKRKRFSEAQLMRMLHEAETLDNVRDVCRPRRAESPHHVWR